MIRNGQIVCNICNLIIDPRYHTVVRILRAEGDRDNPDDYAHFHKRYQGDCYDKTAKREAALAPPKKPTPEDFRQYNLYLQGRTT